MLTTVLLSRIQFALTISIHILFPAFSIGLATFLAIMEGMWLATKQVIYLNICKFWMKIFALTFGMGVVSGIVMEFQLGTNWSLMATSVGDVLGALFTYEVLTAFFIEAGFLGVMIFGWNRVGPKLHYFATLLVTVGVTLSAFWILSANSWMQTPSGVSFALGRFEVINWWQVIFNPSDLPRFIHMLLAAYISTLFMIAGICAYYLLRNKHVEVSRICFSFAMWGAVILVFIQIFVGDAVGLIIHQYQPIKTAAMEAVWHTQQGAPLVLFAWPSMASQSNLYAISIPHLAGFINTHEWNGTLTGLTTVSPADQPYVPFVFFGFRIMVGLGILMFLVALWGLVLRMRKRLFESPWFFRICELMSPSGFIALWAGWIVAETGRQPWVVYNYLRTKDVASPISVTHVIISLALIVVIYGLIFGVFYFRYLWRILEHGPADVSAEDMPFSYMHTQVPFNDKEKNS
jgi:cytochrome bd ubiquinol oxidase subunit I